MFSKENLVKFGLMVAAVIVGLMIKETFLKPKA